jgi:hypothetical protein
MTGVIFAGSDLHSEQSAAVRLGITARLFLALLVVSICHALRLLSQGFGVPYARYLSLH